MGMKFYVLFVLMSINILTFAQENCSDGIDNDGDGLIDCYDPDCGDSTSCYGFYLSKPEVDTTCKFILPPNPSFQPIKKWNVNTGSPYFFVADIDADAVPELLNGTLSSINIINGTTGIIEKEIVFNLVPGFTEVVNDRFAVGDIDGDGFGEIITSMKALNVSSGVIRGYLICAEHDGNIKWLDSIENTASGLNKYPAFPDLPLSVINLADFNEDGIAEFYIGGYIFNALDGSMLLASTDDNNALGTAIAVDVLDSSASCPDCNGLELVAGNKVYSVDVIGGTITSRVIAPAGLMDGYVAIADVNIDGQLDIVTNIGGFGSGNTIQIYVWDPANESSPGVGTQIGTTITQTGQGSGGRPNVGNYDLDPELEIGVAGKTRYYVYEYNSVGNTLTEKWNNIIFDQSAYTGSTAFDFDCDGIAEVVYRDEQNLFVYDGATGNIKFQTPCTSGTAAEYPSVADIDRDGHADILCDCGNFGGITVFSSAANDWAKSRSVVHQTNYFNVNINDDLTIPKVQQKQNHPSLPELNSYLNQANLFDQNGDRICYTYHPDPQLSVDTLFNNGCNNTIVLEVCNLTALLGEGVADSTKIIFYTGDPHSGGTVLLDTFIHGTVAPGVCRYFSYLLPQGNYQVFAYINDDGSDPTNAPVFQYAECDSMNNWDSISIVVDTTIIFTGLDSLYCSSDAPVVLTGDPPGGTFSGIGIVGNTFDPALAGAGGPYVITYTSGGGCGFIFMDTTRVEPSDIYISNDTAICLGDTVLLSASGGDTYSWNPSTNLSCNDCPMPQAAPLSTIDYIITVVDTVLNCSATDTVTIIVDSPATIIATGDTSICLGDSILLSVSGGITYNWAPSTGLSNSNISDVIAFPDTTTKYIVVIDSQSACADVNVVAITVVVNDLPPTDICCDDTIQVGESSTITTSATGTFIWSPTQGLDNPLSSNPIASPDSTTTYKLIITSSDGCISVDSVTIFVITVALDVPSSFTPNGDNQNNEFKIIHSGIAELESFDIFNRWGVVIFKTNDINQGWDGRYKGINQEVGVYNYRISYTIIGDNTLLYKIGTVILLR